MSALQQLSTLPIPEKIQLVTDLWDTIGSSSELPELSPSQLAELDRRIDDYEQSPDEGADWETLKKEMLNRHRG